jgi:MraZ protein
MDSLVGTYEYTIDDQGRMNIPASFRKDLSSLAKKAFTLIRSSDSDGPAFLIMYPQEVWSTVASQMNRQPANDLRQVLIDSAQPEMDSQGRISIPQKLREFAGLRREIVIQGMLDHAEIWDRESFSKNFRRG